MIVKRLLFFDRTAAHACDGRCDKAWGINTRPTVPSRADRAAQDNPDDYALLADDELGIAPIDPGTYEGGCAKPRGARGPDDINKWCVRECERAWLSPPGQPDKTPELPDFSERVYNIAPPRGAPSTGLIDKFTASFSKEQVDALMTKLDTSQKQKLTEILNAITATKKDDA